MLKEIHIKNFKSIVDDKIELGRVNVFIGENGCGKSNILEAVAVAGTCLNSQIDLELLLGKGVRGAKPTLMVNAFSGRKIDVNIDINIKIQNASDNVEISMFPTGDDINSSKWIARTLAGGKEIIDVFRSTTEDMLKHTLEIITNEMKLGKYKFEDLLDNTSIVKNKEFLSQPSMKIVQFIGYLPNFLIYCLNTPALRGMTTQSHKEPVGIYGEGLDVLIANFDNEERAKLAEFNYMIDWLDTFLIDTQDAMKLKGYKMNRSKSTLYFSDKYMTKKNNVFSSENANEGILHVLFYLGVMISKRTPKFFAIDNIEACLNPHLCRHLMVEICKLARDTDKQLMITTHNPAILDGLNLFDDDVRLFEVKRNDKGHTVTRRIKIKPETDLEKYKLSELWTRGYLGAIAQNF